MNTTMKIAKADLIIHGSAVMLGVMIVLVNAQGLLDKPVTNDSVDHYMEKILSRMDSTGAQLSRWERLDVAQSQ